MLRILGLLTWLAFPLYVWQGIRVRLRTHRLMPPQGPVRHHHPGEGDPLRLLVLGDSSAAGIGIEHTADGLAARLSAELAARTGRPVETRAAGFNSAVSRELRDHVVGNIREDGFTHIVLSVGTNDAKNFHTLRRFKREFGGLLYALRARWPDAEIVWSPVIEMTRVPALPATLARILEIRARLINRMGERLCLERGALPAERLPIEDPAAGFSRDGFHASAAGYQAWAEHVADRLLAGRSSPAAG